MTTIHTDNSSDSGSVSDNHEEAQTVGGNGARHNRDSSPQRMAIGTLSVIQQMRPASLSTTDAATNASPIRTNARIVASLATPPTMAAPPSSPVETIPDAARAEIERSNTAVTTVLDFFGNRINPQIKELAQNFLGMTMSQMQGGASAAALNEIAQHGQNVVVPQMRAVMESNLVGAAARTLSQEPTAPPSTNRAISAPASSRPARETDDASLAMVKDYLNGPTVDPEIAEATFESVKPVLCDRTYPSSERMKWIAQWAAKANELPLTSPAQRATVIGHLQDARMLLDTPKEKLDVVQPIITNLTNQELRTDFINLMASRITNMAPEGQPFGYVALAEKIQDQIHEPQLRRKAAQTLVDVSSGTGWGRNMMHLHSTADKTDAVEAMVDRRYDPRNNNLSFFLRPFMPARV